MRQSTRLIFNTSLTYVRMALTVGVGLATTRLMLQALGEEDFGVFAVVFAAATLLTLVSDSLLNSVMTRLAIEIGRSDPQGFREMFNTSLSLFAGLGVLTLFAGLASGGAIMRTLEIPAGRAAMPVFWMALLGLVFAVFAIPFRALLHAHQSMGLLTLVDASDSLRRLLASAVIFLVSRERLLWLCALLAVTSLLQTVLMAFLAFRSYPESRPTPSLFRREALRRLLHFGLWDTVIGAAWRLRMQGSHILLNIVFGPTVNAAYAVATQLGMLQNNLASSIYAAAQPAVVTNAARREHATVHALVLVIGKYMVLAMLVLLVPLLMEPRMVLALWLGAEPPQHAVGLVPWVSAWIALYYLSAGHQMAIQALGSYRGYAVLMLVMDVAILVVAAAWLHAFGGGPSVVPAVTLLLTLLLNVARAVYVGRQIDLPVRSWLTRTVLPVAITGIPGLLAALLVRTLLPSGVPRLAAVSLAYIAVSSPLLWLAGLEDWERQHFRRLVSAAVARVRLLARRGVVA